MDCSSSCQCVCVCVCVRACQCVSACVRAGEPGAPARGCRRPAGRGLHGGRHQAAHPGGQGPVLHRRAGRGGREAEQVRPVIDTPAFKDGHWPPAFLPL